MVRIKKYIKVVIVCLLVLGSFSMKGQCLQNLSMGKLEASESYINLQQGSIKLYQVDNILYIPLNAVRQLGVCVEAQEGILYLSEIYSKESETYGALEAELRQDTLMAKLPLYCGNVRAYALWYEPMKDLLVPVEALRGLGKMTLENQAITLEEDKISFLSVVKVEEGFIKSQVDYPQSIKLRHWYWQNGQFIQEEEVSYIEAYERKPLALHLENIYVGTQIQEINGLSLNEQVDYSVFLNAYKHYSLSMREKELEKVFPEFKIIAKIKYATGPFKEGDQVEIWRSDKRSIFYVRGETGKKYLLPSSCLQMLGAKGYSKSKPAPSDIEEFVNVKNIQSETPYLVWTDLARQRTYVFIKKQAQWQLEKSFICSSGKNDNPTPTGMFKVEYTIPYFGVEKGFRCKNVLVFFRDYMYHSILFDKSGQYIKSGQYDLGRMASHGCIRLSETDSYWLYCHIPVGTTVWIR